MGGTSFRLFFALNHHHETFFFFFFFFLCIGPGLQTVLQRQKIKPTMGQKKLKIGFSFETLPQTRDCANNGPKRRGPTMGLNELGPLNIYLKLKIGPTMGQREKSQQMT
jgi:hypothetical protein